MKTPLVLVAISLAFWHASATAVFNSDFTEASLEAIAGLEKDCPGAPTQDFSLNTANDTLDFLTTDANMWSSRADAPIAWVAAPSVVNGETWSVETYVTAEKDGSNTQEVAGITFYGGADGGRPDFTYGLDDWNGWQVTLQGLGDDNPRVNGSDLGNASGVYLRVEITEGGTADTYNFFYKVNAGDEWIQMGGTATNFVSSFANSRVGLFLKSASPGGGSAQFHYLTLTSDLQSPEIASAAVSEVRSTTATLNGELLSEGGVTPTVWVCWGDDDAGETLDSWDHKVNLGEPAAGLLLHPLTGLVTGTSYYYRFHASNSVGDAWSDVQTFTPSLPELTVSADHAIEGASGQTAVTFEVTLSYAVDFDVTIDYATLHGSTDGNDFTPDSGQTTIPSGQTTATITVWINGDEDEEIDENFILRINDANGVLISATEVQGTILSDDGNHLSPIAVTADTANGLVYVALQNAKRVAVVDAATELFMRSIALPGAPNGLCLNAAGTRLYVTSGGPAGQVHVIDTASGSLIDSWDVGHTPMSPTLSPDEDTLYVCNRFDADVSFVELSTGNTIARVPVEREPHACVVTSNGNTLFVANLLPSGPATSSTVAANVSVIDTSSQAVTGTVVLPRGSHSLRGMCLAPDDSSLYVTHILSRYFAPTTQVTRGWINTNALTVIDPATAASVNTVLLDDLDEGAANPWGVSCSPDGAWLCVAHAGSHEISAIDRGAMESKLAETSVYAGNDLTFLAGLRVRIPLSGNGPRGIAVAAGKVFAAEYFSDSLAVADLPGSGSPVGRELMIGWQAPPDAARRGEMFYNDATLCLQGWQSCASCHPDARSDGLNWDLLNDGFGNPKNSKSHIASMSTPPAMSTGIRPDAEAGIRAGLKYIQFVNRDESYALDIEAYFSALQPVESPYLVNGQLSTAAVNGQAHFEASDCANCHNGPEFTNLRKYNMGTGIGREAGLEFDTPTLLELWRSGPYLHDGRSSTVRDVIVTESHGNSSRLSHVQVDELIEYLLSL